MVFRAISRMTGKPHREMPQRSALSRLGLLTALFAGGNAAALFLRLIGGFLTARVTEPAVLGLFNGFALVLGYVPFLQLGILNGLNRELPYLIGAGDREGASTLAAAAQGWALLIGGAAGAVLIGAAAWYFPGRDLTTAAGWAAQAVNVFFLIYAQTYLQVTYRTRGDFARLAMINVVQSSAGLVLVLLVLVFGFYGLCLRSVLTGAAGMVLLWLWRPIRVAPAWDLKKLFHLFKIGAPIFAVGQIYGWWMILDSTLVLYFLKADGLGLYQLAIIVGSTLVLLPSSLSQVLYPRMAEQYGRTGRLEGLVGQVRRPVMLLAAVAAPVVIMCWFLLEPLTSVLLPRYAPGIPAAKWTLVFMFVSCFEPANIVFNVVRRQDLYVMAILSGFAVYVATLLLLTRNDVSLASFPQAMTAGRIVFVACSYAFIGRLVKKEVRAGSGATLAGAGV